MNNKPKKRPNGNGSIRKVIKEKNGKSYEYWEATITVGYDTGTGKQIRKSFTGKTQAEALAKMNQAIADIQNDDYIEPTKMTVSEWLDIWLKTYCVGVKYQTMKKYRTDCEYHIKPALGAIQLSKLSNRQIQTFINNLAKSGKVHSRKDRATGKQIVTTEGLSPKSIKNIYGVLEKSLKDATIAEYIKRIPQQAQSFQRWQRRM